MTPKPLPDDVRTMIEAYRTSDGPGANEADVIWERVQGAVHLPAIHTNAHVGQNGLHPLNAGIRIASKLGASAKLWIVAGVGLGMSSGAVALWKWPARPVAPPRATAAAIDAPIAAPTPTASQRASTLEAPVVDDVSVGTDQRSSRARGRASAEASARDFRQTEKQLAEERRPLDEARAAMTRRDSTSALAALQDHQRAFPSGLLTEERESLRVHAFVLAHDEVRARASAETFARRFPHSMYSGAIDRALQSLK